LLAQEKAKKQLTPNDHEKGGKKAPHNYYFDCGESDIRSTPAARRASQPPCRAKDRLHELLLTRHCADDARVVTNRRSIVGITMTSTLGSGVAGGVGGSSRHILASEQGAGSEFASFVAATLRDKVVSDLLGEVRDLRQQVQMASTIQLTGPNATPVYASASLRNGCYNEADPTFWYMSFLPTTTSKETTTQQPQQCSCPVSDLQEVEIYVGGMLIGCFGGTGDDGAANIIVRIKV